MYQIQIGKKVYVYHEEGHLEFFFLFLVSVYLSSIFFVGF